MLNSYRGKIKCIYIDPPYNTKTENFIYPDRFDKEEVEALGFENVSEDDFRRMEFSFNNKSSHNGWLSFMYPRLKLARDLLSDDGVIFVSIDDNEQANLRILMDEIFGEDNFMASIIWRGGRRNMAKHVSNSHEYILFYTKDVTTINATNISFKAKKEGLEDVYKQYEKLKKEYKDNYQLMERELKHWYDQLPDNHPSKDISHYSCVDERGIYFPDNISRGGGGGPKWDLINPITGNIVKTPSRGWAASKYEDLLEAVKENKVHFNGDGVPCAKSYLTEKEFDAIDSVFYKDRRGASKNLEKLMEGKVFDFPKDVSVIKKLLQISTSSEDVILDFFAGSGTTAQAVMELNKEDGGMRKFILCQIDEAIDENKKKEAFNFCVKNNLPPVISSITIERVRRAGEKILKEIEKENAKKQPDFLNLENSKNTKPHLDVGFKCFDLIETSKIVENDNQLTLQLSDNDSLSKIYHLILKDGVFNLNVKIETIIENCLYLIENQTYYIINAIKLENDENRKILSKILEDKNKNFKIDGFTASINLTLQQYQD
ncbi:MAG: site-specific DNA-methyltransferase, partial [Pelagibacterales bacterium]|nr:site-specific DNA-methyltransferase [Pelagibacterales bacterium]